MEQLQYPIGRNPMKSPVDLDEAKEMVANIAALPKVLTSQYLQLLDKDALDVSYRQGGWTARQVIHHLADSHMNAYIRTKLVLTEDTPTLKPYNQIAWAQLPDSSLDPGVSLSILTSMHDRWTSLLLATINEETLKRDYFHPEHQKLFTLGTMIAMYEWHGKHHSAHLNIILQQPTSL